MFSLERIDHVALTVSNVADSVKWYKEVLGLEEYFPGAWGGVPVMMGKDGTCLALFGSSVSKPGTVSVREHAVMRHHSGLTGRNLYWLRKSLPADALSLNSRTMKSHIQFTSVTLMGIR